MRPVRHRRARPAARDRDGRADGRRARPPRAGRRRRRSRDDGVALGFRRLAIIDLSRRRQPAVRERRRRGCSSSTTARSTTTASCAASSRRAATASAARPTPRSSLARLRRVGRALRRALQRHVGVRALGRPARARLFCSRDRFGVKPFYYRCDGGRLVFASELKAFRADPQTRLEPQPPRGARLPRAGLRRPHRRDVLRGDRASSRRRTRSIVDARRAARPALLGARAARAAPATRPTRCASCFLDAVRLRLRSDVPVGTCLSGGLDSSAIVCAVDHLLRTEAENARPVGERQRTFTAFFEEPGLRRAPVRARRSSSRRDREPHWVTFDAARAASTRCPRSSRRRTSRSARRASSRSGS